MSTLDNDTAKLVMDLIEEETGKSKKKTEKVLIKTKPWKRNRKKQRKTAENNNHT